MSFANMAELRTSLIGNKDLKFKLFRDLDVVAQLNSELAVGVSSLVSSSSCSPQVLPILLNQVENHAVIIKMVCSFITEVDYMEDQVVVSSSGASAAGVPDGATLSSPVSSYAILSVLQPATLHIAQFLRFYMETILPILPYSQLESGLDEDTAKILDRILNDLLDVASFLLSYASNGTLNEETRRIYWRWITTLSVLAPLSQGFPVAAANSLADPTGASSVPTGSLLLKLLKMVPFLLGYPDLEPKADLLDSDLSVHVMTLLSVLIRRLNEESHQIFRAHRESAESATSSTIIDDEDADKEKDNDYKDFSELVAILKGSNLPLVEPGMLYFKKSLDLELPTAVITCVGQIFSYVKENNCNIEKTFSKSTTEINGTILPSRVFLTLLFLLKYENTQLNLVTLNLIYFYLNNLCKEELIPLDLIFENYQKLLPRINELISIENWNIPRLLLSPSKILAEMCSQFPLLNDDLRRANLDVKLVSMLTGSLYKNNRELKIFKLLKKLSKECSKIVDFSRLSPQKSIANRSSDILLWISVYTSRKEEHRSRITQFNRNKEGFGSGSGSGAGSAPGSIPSTSTSRSKSGNDSIYKLSGLNLSYVIFEIVDDYRFLLTQIQMTHMMIKKSVNNESRQILGKRFSDMIVFLDDTIFTNVLYLIRSLSRSVAVLRTFFVECNSYPSTMKKKSTKSSEKDSFIGNLLHVLKGIENCTKIVNYYNKKGILHFDGNHINHRNCLNKSILLGILANFVLDFSSFRVSIVMNDGFLRSLVEIYDNVAFVQEGYQANNVEELEIERNTIQYNILQVLQNYTYNETDENKKNLMDQFPLINLFDKIAFGLNLSKEKNVDNNSKELQELKLKQKVLALDIIRNLTSGSSFFSSKISRVYKSWIVNSNRQFSGIGWYQFLTDCLTQKLWLYGIEDKSPKLYNQLTLLNLCKNDHYPSLLLAINFIEDHKYTNMVSIQEKVRKKERIFKLWLNFLNLSVSKEFEEEVGGDINVIVNASSNLNLIQVSICWVLINMTWKNEIFGSRRNDNVQFKIYDTILVGRVNDRIEIEESDDEDEDDSDDSDDDDEEADEEDEVERSDGNMDVDENETTKKERAQRREFEQFATPVNRAKYLREFGFLPALDQLIKRLNGPNEVNGRRRFDSIMGNDLLEKAKTAKNQILELTGRRKRPRLIPVKKRKEPILKPTGAIDHLDTLQLSNSRSLVTRGGEGYGYESDSDPNQEESYLDSDEDMEGVDEFDDCWVR